MSYGNSYNSFDNSSFNPQAQTAEISMGSSQYQDYDRVSHISDPRRPPSPGPSRPYPAYDRYVPGRDDPSYASEYGDSYRPDSWRPSYRHRGFSGDHYEPPNVEKWTRPNNSWSSPHNQSYQNRRDTHYSGSWDRRDTLAERMLEPSDAWKEKYVPGSPRDDHHSDYRIRDSRDMSADGRSRDTYSYAAHGDSYRPHTSPRRHLEDVHYSRPADCYRPDYDESDLRGSADGYSGIANNRRRPARSPLRHRDTFGGSHYEPDDRSYSESPSSSRASSPASPRRPRRGNKESSFSPRSSRSGGRVARSYRRARSRSESISSTDSRSYPSIKPRSNLPVRRDTLGPRTGGTTTTSLSVNTSGLMRSVTDFASPVSASHPPMHPSLPARPAPSGGVIGARDRTYSMGDLSGSASPSIPRSYVGAYTRDGESLVPRDLVSRLPFKKKTRRGGQNRKQWKGRSSDTSPQDVSYDSGSVSYPNAGDAKSSIPPYHGVDVVQSNQSLPSLSPAICSRDLPEVFVQPSKSPLPSKLSPGSPPMSPDKSPLEVTLVEEVSDGLPAVLRSSPVSSELRSPSLQTPSPSQLPPHVVVARPHLDETDSTAVPVGPVSPHVKITDFVEGKPVDGETRFQVPREAASLREALRMAITARKQYDQQSREARVNPVIMANRALVKARLAEEASMAPSVQEHTLEERAREREAKAAQLRPALIKFVSARKETVEEKTERLRREYLQLHHAWVARCAELDGVPLGHGPSEEVSVVSSNGRTTRRSAAVIGDAVRSDLEMEQIIASLGNEDMFDPALLAIKNVAKIPDMISVTQGRVDYVFDDTNNRVDDPASFYDPGPEMAAWTDHERATFLAQYAAHPKQFGLIAESLPNKSQAQCVQFYYLHKKKLVDFRQAVTTFGRTKRRGGRRTAKKKGNALLADIRQHDAEVSRDSSEGPAVNRRKRTVVRRSNLQIEQTPMSTPTPEPEARPKRRRAKATATQEQQDGEASESESRPPKRARRTRKTKVSSELAEPDAEDQTPAPAPTSTPTPAPPPAPTLAKAGDPPPRRRAASGPVHWSDEDKALFLTLLSQHGDDFKRIAASMPNKTTVQVSAYYKAHVEELDLARVVANAPKRSPTPEPSNHGRNSSTIVICPASVGPTSANVASKKVVTGSAWNPKPPASAPMPDAGWPMVPLGANPVDFAYATPFHSVRPQGEPLIHIGARSSSGMARLPPVTATQASYLPLSLHPQPLSPTNIPPSTVGSHIHLPRPTS